MGGIGRMGRMGRTGRGACGHAAVRGPQRGSRVGVQAVGLPRASAKKTGGTGRTGNSSSLQGV